MKIKVGVRPEIPFPVGLHLVYVAAINYARKSSGELILRDFEGTPYPVIEIKFKGVENKALSFSEQFSTDPKSQWIWDNLSRALKIDNKTTSVSAEEAKEKPLYIIVAGEVFFEKNSNDLKRNPDGTIYFKKKLRLKFFEYSEIMPPQLIGDPADGSLPSGIFLINDDIDLNQFEAIKDQRDEF